MSTYGYGIDITQISYQTDFQNRLKEMYMNNEDRKEDYLEYCQDNNLSPEEAFEDYIDDYENPTMLWDGAEGMLVDIINQDKFDGYEVFRFEDYCIYVAADIPRNEAEKAKMPTEEDIENILREYLNPLIKEPATIEWQRIHDDYER